MKTTFNIMNFKKLFFLPLIILALMVSCQTEETEITNPPQEDIIQGNSETASLMSRTALNDGSIDNIIDYANCLEVVLPVTVTANGVTITIESYTDYDQLEALLDAFTSDNDDVVIAFPITVILNDYSELVINSQLELEAQIENCNDENQDDDDIECIDFQYPIAFSIYNTDFQIIETITINDDETLYDFLQTLNGPVLASLNFPVILVLANGETVEVNSNQELDITITEAEDDCDEDDDYDWNDDDFECWEEDVELALKECIWNIVSYNGDDNLINLNIDFELGYNFTASENGNTVHTGSWSVSTDGASTYIDFNTNWEDVAGNWAIVECDDDRFKLIMNNTIMIIERDCDNDNSPFDCFQSFDAVIEKCDSDNDGFEVFNLTNVFANCATPNFLLTYHETQTDAETGVNAIVNPEAYTNMNPFQIIYVRVETANNPDEFEVFTISLSLIDCTNNTCILGDVEGTLMLCEWTISNYAGDSSFSIFNINFMDNQAVVIESDDESYTGNWAIVQDGDFIYIEFSNISGGDVQVLNGINFKVVECTGDQMILHDVNDSNNELVLDKDCT